MSSSTNDKAASTPVGARVKFRDDHPEYPGMVGTVEEDITIPGGEPMVGVRLDSVPATADEIEPFDDAEEERGAALALAYRDRMAAPRHLTDADQQVIHDLLTGGSDQTSAKEPDASAPQELS